MKSSIRLRIIWGDIISKKYKPDYGGTDCQRSDNKTFHFTMGSVLDPLIVANKGAPRKDSKVTTKQNTDKHRIKSFHESRPIKCGTCGKGGHNRRTGPWRVSKFVYLCSNYVAYFCFVVLLILFHL